MMTKEKNEVDATWKRWHVKNLMCGYLFFFLFFFCYGTEKGFRVWLVSFVAEEVGGDGDDGGGGGKEMIMMTREHCWRENKNYPKPYFTKSSCCLSAAKK